jgi:hypothetical protein
MTAHEPSTSSESGNITGKFLTSPGVDPTMSRGALFGTFAFNEEAFGAIGLFPEDDAFESYRIEGKWSPVPPIEVAAMMRRFGRKLPEWLRSYVVAHFLGHVASPLGQVASRRGRKPLSGKSERDDWIRRTYKAALTQIREEADAGSASGKSKTARSSPSNHAAYELAAQKVADSLPGFGFHRLGVKAILNIVSSQKEKGPFKGIK